MRKLFSNCLKVKDSSSTQPVFHHFRKGILLLVPAFLVLVIIGTGCNKQEPNVKAKDPAVKEEAIIMNSEDDFRNAYKNEIHRSENDVKLGKGFSFTTFIELLKARLATAKYRDFDKAIADGYADIHVVMPNMGYHYMKSEIVNAKFEITKPEILVYNKRLDGSFQLVAIEYAVPIDLTPEKAPEGFTGSADVWDRNTGFGLWLLHAWVWQFNPDGVFHPTNPDVHVAM